MLNTKKQQQELIDQIHNEFDSAQERLLAEANKILSEIVIPQQYQHKTKAERLKEIGFMNTQQVKEYDQACELREKELSRQRQVRDNAELIRYHKQVYPFQKFLTEEELDRICDKYGLVHAPVANYIKDVPEKNLREIEAAKPLVSEDMPFPYYVLKVTRSLVGDAKDIERVKRYGIKLFKEDDALWTDLNALFKQRGLNIRTAKEETGPHKGSFREVHKVFNRGLFIAAPKSHFDLTGLKNDGMFGFKEMFRVEVKDPIVFRYCRGGIQVLSKWGLEAEDPALLNEINN